ncbi:MAG: endoglucanase [Isosphaeraceae bacterium]|jgi:endoglucanase|nr:MAG: endoglucanase [Isosphaeraceae bacterium]
MNRRHWLQTVGAAMAPAALWAQDAQPTPPTPSRLPAWRGFNLLSMFYLNRSAPDGFSEADFDLVADLGFNFVRLPMDYRYWVDPNDWTQLREEVLAKVDQAVQWGRERRIHVQLNLHRAPGFTVAQPAEPRSLWTDPTALEACAAHWAHFARRYKGRPNSELSFNPLNEPTNQVTPEDHRRVIERLAQAIRAEDPDRLIVCDGRGYARIPPSELVGLKVAVSTHHYDPHRLTHYKASWVEGSSSWPVPTWPLQEGDRRFDRQRLYQERIEPWKELERQGVGVHCGEFGCHNQTPHSVALAWMRDVLALLREAGWGWALWNLRGSFGIFDSQRSDVRYEPYRGHQLDRAMLELLREASA